MERKGVSATRGGGGGACVCEERFAVCQWVVVRAIGTTVDLECLRTHCNGHSFEKSDVLLHWR